MSNVTLKHPNLPFVLSNGILSYYSGAKEAATPEIQVQALILLELQKLNESREVKAPEPEPEPETKKPAVNVKPQ